MLISLVAIVGSITFVTTRLINTDPSFPQILGAHICDQAHERASCINMVSEVAPGGSLETSSVSLLQMFLKNSASRVKHTIEMVNDVHHRINDRRQQAALADCVELMDLSKDRLEDSMAALENGNAYTDVHVWLSSVLTNHVTCMDGLDGPALSIMEPNLKHLISRARISLAIMVTLAPSKADVLEPLYGKLPSWVTSRDRKLLETLPNAMINADVVVAKDGSGNYKTINEAVASAPNNGKARFTIYVKSGTYIEKVEIGKAKKNVMLTGDGMDKTIITGSLNVVDGSTTFNSATVGNIPLLIFLFKISAY